MTGNAIQRMRDRRKLTVRQLGAILGVHSSTVTRDEHKELRRLSVEKLSEYANALQTSVAHLLKLEARHAR